MEEEGLAEARNDFPPNVADMFREWAQKEAPNPSTSRRGGLLIVCHFWITRGAERRAVEEEEVAELAVEEGRRPAK